jgi:isopentenyl-diphosphate delta-isomerase type 1
LISFKPDPLEFVILVDENDTAIGSEEKLKAHQLGLLHRAFSVCIVRKYAEKWHVLLQQRALGKYHSGGLWTNTCCSHPRPDESTKNAAERRLKEEMGLLSDLTPIDKFIYRAELDNELIEHELDHVLIGEIDNVEINYNPDEVMAYRWVELSLLVNEIDKNPEQYTAWLKQVVKIVQKHLS